MSDLNDVDGPAGQLMGEILFPPSWQGLRQQIVYLAQFGNSIQVIYADEDGGKTSFFDHLLATGLGSTTVGVTVAMGAGVVIFFRDVLRELGLRPDDRATLGELAAALRGYVQTLHKEGSRAVLVVDDAHYLTDSELGALVSTLQGQSDAGVGLHVVLFAEPGLAARIDALQVLDVAVHDAPLPAFSVAEIHQLLTARQNGSHHVGAEQVQRIWYQSRGLPGVAVEMVEHLQPPPPAAGKIMSLRGLPIGHIAALIVLCGVLIWAFMVRQTDKSSPAFEPQEIPIEPVTSTSLVSATESGQIPDSGVEQTSPEASDGEQRNSETAASLPAGADTNPDDGANLDGGVGGGRADDTDTSVGQRASVDESTDSDVQPVTSAAPAVATPRDFRKTKLTASEQNKGGETARTLSEKGAAKLLSLPSNAYVLQLMAASAEDKLAAYVAEQPNRGNLFAYKTERDGKILYILVEGYYADKASAQAAVLNLPPQQQEGGPWPKRIEQIHQELRKSH